MRDVLLALFLLSAFPMVIYRYQVGAMVIGFISFMYPQSNTFGFALSIQWLDIFLVLSLVGYFLKQGYKDYKHHTIITLTIILYLWCCLSTVFAINWMFAYPLWLKFSKVLVLCYVAFAMLTTEKRLFAFMKVMVISIGFYGVKGGLFTLINGGGASVLGPINSFFADNNGMALVLTMTLPFMIFFAWHAEHYLQRYFALFCALTTAIAVLGTQSRTGLVALGVTILYFTWLQKKMFRALLIIVPVAATAFFFMPDTWVERMQTTTELEQDTSFQGRVDMWKASVQIANDYPVFGGGYNVIYLPQVAARYIPIDVTVRAIHSAYFQMMAEHGYVGFAIFMIMLSYSYYCASRMARQAKQVTVYPWMQDLTIAIRSSYVGFLVLGLTANIAFFDLTYFIMVITALADNLLKQHVVEKKFSLEEPSQKTVAAAPKPA